MTDVKGLSDHGLIEHAQLSVDSLGVAALDEIERRLDLLHAENERLRAALKQLAAMYEDWTPEATIARNALNHTANRSETGGSN